MTWCLGPGKRFHSVRKSRQASSPPLAQQKSPHWMMKSGLRAMAASMKARTRACWSLPWVPWWTSVMKPKVKGLPAGVSAARAVSMAASELRAMKERRVNMEIRRGSLRWTTLRRVFFQPEAARRSLMRYISLFLLRIHSRSESRYAFFGAGLDRAGFGASIFRTRCRLRAIRSAMSGPRAGSSNTSSASPIASRSP